MCLRESYQSLDNSDAPPEVVDAVVEESSRLASVLLHGDGEPLLHPELLNILARLKRAMPPEGKVGLLTNGTLLNQDMARALVDRGLDWLTLSIDGATKSTVEHIRRGSHFETIVENLRHGVEYGRRTRPGGIQFTFQFTMRGSNVQEFPDLVKLAGRLGVDNVTSSILRDFGTGKFLPVPASALDVVYAEAILAAREQGVNLTLQPPRPLEQLQCNFLQEAYVHVSGNVGGCCFREPGHSERPLHILGNVKEMPLSEIWNSPRSRDLRRKLMAGNFPERCSVCEDKERGFPLKA
jgi:MoaA/NifB/PqqE/SkfB family radical SAM enzyme